MSYLLSSAPTIVAESNITPWSNGARGVLKKDADGYYCGVLVGALGTYNSAREFYVANDIIFNKLLTESIMAKKLAKKVLYVELGHPKRYAHNANGTVQLLTDTEYCNQYMTISDRNHCAHVRSIRIAKAQSPDKYNNYPYLLYADVKPQGPYADVMEARMQDPNQNGCFSMRWLANKIQTPTGIVKEVFECVTFDFVGEGGIELCVKDNHLSFEDARPSVVVNRDMLVAIRQQCQLSTDSEESEGIASVAESIITSMDNITRTPNMPGSFYM